MKKYFTQVLKLLFIVLIAFALLVFFDVKIVKSQFEGTYQASIIDKEARLTSINEPKIILVGNSNLSFGINSKMIEDEFNMPVVNLGLHGGLGNAFHEEMAKLNINKGDIILAAYSEFSDDDKIVDAELAWETIEYNYNLWKIIRLKDWSDMFMAYPKYLLKKYIYFLTGQGNKDDQSEYSRSAINEYGDNVFNRQTSMNYEMYSNYRIKIPIINETFIKRTNEFNDYVNSKGATLLIIGYPIINGNLSPNKQEFDEFTNLLKQKVNCQVISQYSDYLIPYNYFYELNLHLNNEGAKIRTKQLIKDLKEWKNKTHH